MYDFICVTWIAQTRAHHGPNGRTVRFFGPHERKKRQENEENQQRCVCCLCVSHHSHIAITITRRPVPLQDCVPSPCTFWAHCIFRGWQNTRRMYVHHHRRFRNETEMEAKNTSAAGRLVHNFSVLGSSFLRFLVGGKCSIRSKSIYVRRSVVFWSHRIHTVQQQQSASEPTLIHSHHITTTDYQPPHILQYIYTKRKNVSPPQCFMCLP